ncbi:hypothetical protein BG004_006385 [Podila humilis]|nr:hypothetical protein BG004_006385 [Podila humilis]
MDSTDGPATTVSAPTTAPAALVEDNKEEAFALSARRIRAKRVASKVQLSRDAKAVKTRIRRLWQDPRQPELSQSRHGSKNQYVLLEESLTGILQIAPLIIQNAKAPTIDNSTRNSVAYTSSMGTSDTPTTLSQSLSFASTTHSKSSKSSGSTPTIPLRPRARTTSSNSTSATRYQIATSILQPSEPTLTDLGQPTLCSTATAAALGEPALSTIALVANPTSPSTHEDMQTQTQIKSGALLSESSALLISKLLKLSSTFTGAIRTLCEQQNEKVLRFDDDMILDLLTRWEQEACVEDEELVAGRSTPTSIVTLGATDTLERYHLTVGRVWEETEVILSSIRKIRDLVEFGRVQHHSGFDPEDSEEEAIKKDYEIRETLYSTLLFHANGLVTVLGEFLECVSGIQRLVGTLKTQRKSMERQNATTREVNALSGDYSQASRRVSMSDFIEDEPRPIKVLDQNLARKLRPKTKFKSFADKMRRSFSDFRKRSTTSLLTIFPPLGDGTNEGYSDMFFSDDDNVTEYHAGTDVTDSIYDDEDTYSRTLSPPASPGLKTDLYARRHRRLSSKDSGGPPKQYWPGSVKLYTSDDSLSPVNSPMSTHEYHDTSMARSMSSDRTMDSISTRFNIGSSSGSSGARHSLDSLRESQEAAAPFHVAVTHVPPLSTLRPDNSENRQSILFRRRNSVQSGFNGSNISAPMPAAARPFSAFAAGSDLQAVPRKHNYRVKPPKPPVTLPALPPSPSEPSPESLFSIKQTASNRTSSYLAARSISPQNQTPLILDSPFTRQTSIRMANDRNRYSIKMPADDMSEVMSPKYNRDSSSAFWRRRSYNDALEMSWRALRYESFYSEGSSSNSHSSQATPIATELGHLSRPSSIRLTSFDFMIPFFSRDGSKQSSVRHSAVRPNSMEKAQRRHSSPLILGTESLQSEWLHRRMSHSSGQTESSGSQSSSQNNLGFETSSGHSDFRTQHLQQQQSYHPEELAQIQQQQHYLRDPNQKHGPSSSAAGSNASVLVETESLRIAPLKHNVNQGYTTQGYENGRAGSNVVSGRDTGCVPTRAERSNVGSMPRPLPQPRVSERKKAWEILNLDVKRLNQYSALRAYARPYNTQNNLWALSHPNALQSATSPRVLHICENGADVLVMEMFAGHLQVVAGQLEKLIERLADENAQDVEYVNCFLLSHSFFVDSEDLLARLIARFHIQPRQGEILYFEKWQTVIQVKVLCVIHRWIQVQYEDFELNQNLLKSLKRFLEVDVKNSGFAIEGECIEKNIAIKSLAPLKNCSVIMEQGRFCLQRSRTRKISLSRSQRSGASDLQPPGVPALASPLGSVGTPTRLDGIPSSPASTHVYQEQMIEFGPTPELTTSPPILQLSARDLARYLTLADMKAFRSITVFELMSGWWKRRQALENKNADDSTQSSTTGTGTKAIPSLGMMDIDEAEDGAIEAFTRRANMLSYWVAHEIVSTAGAKTRKQLLKKFIEVARICKSLNNLHTSMFILSALSSTPVRRLTASWKLVSSKDMETLKELEELLDISGNMRCYRQAIAEASAPAIPFLPILLKDITFILDGNPTMIPSKVVAPSTTTTTHSTSSTTGTTVIGNEASSRPGSISATVQLVNFDKFRQLTQYVENAVDTARSADYSFEHLLLRQARVFRPSSPAFDGHVNNDHQNVHQAKGGSHLGAPVGKSNNSHGPLMARRGSQPETTTAVSSGALDHISEMVERRLVKASGLYGAHHRVIEVEFSTRPKGASSLWKGNGSIHGSSHGHPDDEVIRSVQGEEEYLMGLSLMCEPGR